MVPSKLTKDLNVNVNGCWSLYVTVGIGCSSFYSNSKRTKWYKNDWMNEWMNEYSRTGKEPEFQSFCLIDLLHPKLLVFLCYCLSNVLSWVWPDISPGFFFLFFFTHRHFHVVYRLPLNQFVPQMGLSVCRKKNTQKILTASPLPFLQPCQPELLKGEMSKEADYI